MQKEQQMAAVETSAGGGGCASTEQVLGTGVPVCGKSFSENQKALQHAGVKAKFSKQFRDTLVRG